MHSAPFLALLRRSRGLKSMSFELRTSVLCPIPTSANQIAVLTGKTLLIRLVDIDAGKETALPMSVVVVLRSMLEASDHSQVQFRFLALKLSFCVLHPMRRRVCWWPRLSHS
jgi:hypothetical protein